MGLSLRIRSRRDAKLRVCGKRGWSVVVAAAAVAVAGLTSYGRGEVVVVQNSIRPTLLTKRALYLMRTSADGTKRLSGPAEPHPIGSLVVLAGPCAPLKVVGLPFSCICNSPDSTD